MKQDLERLLEQNETFMVEGVLNKNKLAELARQYNPELLNLLISDEKISQHFFATLETGVLVFKKDVFLQFLNNKEFLPDSFTAYKTKIGLATGDKYLSENQEVVLNFPYKDCVLEGGQTKDDAKRQEIFFNETLAPTEINRLLDDKVLTNFKRYDESGEHEVEELSDTDNLIIKGNNLIALHSLKKRFAGKIKLIYIDPPYNTGSDSFGYNDSFNHSTWLTFMKNRFSVAKNLLKDNGVIFVQCDDNEQAYLKVLMDEVFGRDSFVSTIHCQMSTTQGMKVKAAQNGNIVKNAEYILVYSKDGHKNVAINPLYDLRPEYDEHYSLYLKKDGTVGQLKELYDYRFPKDLNNKKALTLKEAFRKSEEFSEIVRTHLAEIVASDKVTGFDLSIGLENGKWNEIERNGRKYILTLDRKGKIRQLLRLQDSWGETDNYNRDEGLRKIRGDWWDGFYLDMGNVGKEGTVDFKNGKKSERLVSQIIKMATNEGDIVLDYHLGSGTTAAVAHKMNRQYIGIEQMDYIETVSVERLKKVIAGEQGGISKDVNWTGGGSFVYAELKNDAQDFKNKIFEATTTEELLELFELAKKSSFLSYRVDPKKLKKNEFSQLSLAEQKQILSEIIDNNNLYVNYSDIDDSDYLISAEDKKLNHAFYGKEK
ncbi:TPA: site-specific DNA-methyltransferase [Streptococcus suis]|nr:site-specific DNA-methyltransferase [Streptococcus suis]HEM3616421.1 site-specific DNA-methyltransferase [Streptococcus suis]HEM3664517.1 site-specific DNA-methyltransferase [Streptococcus suis]